VWSACGVWRPPSKLRLSEWADKNRVLSSESSAEPGAWITDKAPYEREIMDAISDPDVPRVCVQKAAQIGITDSGILNPIGYFAMEEPCPILVVQPTIEMAGTFSTDRLAPMIRDSPNLTKLFGDPKAKDSGNTKLRKAFPGGFVALGGANSAASLSGRPVRVVLLDDVDRFPASAGTEGNPLQLAIARTSAFWNRKAVIVSSPGIAGVSHIEREMDQSTKEHWNLPCPDCGVMQVLDWGRVRFEDFKHGCEACGEHFYKFEWVAGTGKWIATRPVDERGRAVDIRGFYLSGLYNPWIEWEILYVEYLRALRAEEEGDIEPIKAFRNTRLGLLHEETGQKVDVNLYAERREVYKLGAVAKLGKPVEAVAEVPPGVVVLTGGVDVHERTINYEIVGWGPGRESWGIEYGILDGDPREAEVWTLLDEAVYNRVLTTWDGKLMRLKKIAVDSGYASDFVYAYTKPRQPRAISIKGEGGLGKPFIKGAGTLTKSNGARLITLGVDTGKEEIVNRLVVAKVGPGYCHFPKRKDGEPVRGYDEEYFKGLTAERRIVKAKNGFHTYLWMKRLSQRNEPFDCRNYALAAVALPLSGIKLDTMSRDLWTPPDPKATPTARFGAQKAVDIYASDVGPVTGAGGGTFGAANRPVS
jgi:phage terminase large subunit GpA-like protein